MARTMGSASARVEYTGVVAATTTMSFCCWVENPSVSGTTCKMLACQEDQWRISFNAEKYGGGTPTAGALYFGRSWGTTDHVAEVQSPGATWSGKNHIAVTYDGSSTTNAAKFYLNGTLLTNSFSRNAAGSIDNATGNPNVGNDNAHTLSCLATLAFASFHNVVLTQAEILEHMATGYTGRGRYVAWDLSGDSPERDRSGNGRNGTVTGTTVAANPPIPSPIMRMKSFADNVATALTFNQTISVTSTGTPSLVKMVGKVLAPSATGTPSFQKLIGKNVSVTSTGTAALTGVRVVLVALSAAASGTASLVKQIGKSLSVTSTESAIFTKQVSKTLSASSTGTPTLTAIKAVLLTISAAASGTASLIKQVGKSLTATGTGTASFQKLIGKNVSASATGTPTLTAGALFSVVLSAVATGTASIVTAFIAKVPTLIGVRFGRPKKPWRRRPELR